MQKPNDTVQVSTQQSEKVRAGKPQRTQRPGELQRIGLFIDAQSLSYGIRRLYGRKSRLDFLRLPSLALENCSITGDYTLKKAFVVQQGSEKVYGPLITALRSFGYEVEVVEHGKQDMFITMHIINIAPTIDHIMLVTGNKRLAPLIEQLTVWKKEMSLVTFEGLFEPGVVNQVLIQDAWLLK